jgi:hypothetical protein
VRGEALGTAVRPHQLAGNPGEGRVERLCRGDPAVVHHVSREVAPEGRAHLVWTVIFAMPTSRPGELNIWNTSSEVIIVPVLGGSVPIGARIGLGDLRAAQ